MSQNYTPTKWEDNRTVGTASVMNNMEKGIEDAHNRIDGVDSQINTIADEYVIDYKYLIDDNGYWDNAIETAIKNCNYGGTIQLPINTAIKISRTIVLDKDKSLTCNGKTVIICDYSNWGGHNSGSDVPLGTALYIKPRVAIFNDEQNTINTMVSCITFKCINDNNNVSHGMYLGCGEISDITSNTSVNNSVTGKTFKNLHFNGFYNAVVLSEAWDCVFDNVSCRKTKNTGFLVTGQSVNNFFSNCRAYEGINAFVLKGRDYNGKVKRPEGITFSNGFLGSATNGVVIENSLGSTFNNVIIDLMKENAVICTSSDLCIFSNCYIYSNGNSTVNLANLSENNNSMLSFLNCNFVGSGSNSFAISNCNNWDGLIIEDCSFSNYNENIIFLGINCKAVISSNIFKNNKAKLCIIVSPTATINESLNETRDSNNLIAYQGNVSIKTLNSNIKMNKKIVNDNLTIDFSKGIDFITSDLTNIKANGVQFGSQCVGSDGDFNSIQPISCFFSGSSNATNNPFSAPCIGIQIVYDINFRIQIAYNTAGNSFKRVMSGGTWGEWV